MARKLFAGHKKNQYEIIIGKNGKGKSTLLNIFALAAVAFGITLNPFKINANSLNDLNFYNWDDYKYLYVIDYN